MRESKILEFKENVTNTFLKTVSAFANYGTGEILFGVSDAGTLTGVENPSQVCLDIENRINDNLDPVPRFTIGVNERTSVGDAFYGLSILLGGPFSSGTAKYIITNLGDMIFYAAPLVMTGVSVALANKTGLFNIGAPGQFLMGTLGSLLVALNITTIGKPGLSVLVWILAILVGALCGAIWGCIPGFFRAVFNVNEVIVSIMTNWIAANIVSWVFGEMPHLVN